MDHFALPTDELARARQAGTLQRNFMGYSTHAGHDLLGLGVSAISHIGAAFGQNFRDPPAWASCFDRYLLQRQADAPQRFSRVV